MVISETARRVCTTRAQQVAKPGRQIITFLLFANITLWVIDTFMSHREITQVKRWMPDSQGKVHTWILERQTQAPPVVAL